MEKSFAWIIFVIAIRTNIPYIEAQDGTTCNRDTGPSGAYECIKIWRYSDYQWATCRTDSYVRVTSKNKHQCVDRTRKYCYYQCMLDDYGKEYGFVYSACSCSPYSRQPTESSNKLPTWCYSPDGTDCRWYRECLEKAYPCEGEKDDYAIAFAEKFCKLYESNYDGFSSQGRQWIDAVRKCLQVKLVPLLDKTRVKSCETLKKRAFDSHSPCYLDPDDSSLSYCSLSWTDRRKVFWTIKSAFRSASMASLKGLYEVGKVCYSVPVPGFVKSGMEYIGDGIRSFLVTVKGALNNIRGKRSTPENEKELSKSYFAGKVVDKMAAQLGWKERGVAWFAFATNEAQDKNTISVMTLLADRYTYEAPNVFNNTPPSQPANVSDIVLQLKDSVMKGSLNLYKIDSYEVEVKGMRGCADWNCTSYTFNVAAPSRRNDAGLRITYANNITIYLLFTMMFFMFITT